MEWWSPCRQVIDPASLAGVWAGISVLSIAAAILLAWCSSARASRFR
jgi:hypothetical protein